MPKQPMFLCLTWSWISSLNVRGPPVSAVAALPPFPVFAGSPVARVQG